MRDVLAPDVLLNAYAQGAFPMGDNRRPGKIDWYSPDPRAILPPDRFHVSRSLLKTTRQGGYQLVINQDFAATVSGCAARAETWITEPIAAAYQRLHDLGWAHSAEVRGPDGQLAGGMYGIAIGRAFFGESMFSDRTGGSKMALGAMISVLKDAGFTLFDTQFLTDHLASLGAIEITRNAYLAALAKAVNPATRWQPPVGDIPVYSALQRTSQTS
jgi:leucyl/phenylalanyl-tRNA---protein transferase